ncbi:MAG: membrane integrity-associated transporter subunit PqiC [Oceanicaulis sp.]|nr:membrane integrity-associated transporter subunit PqiC [Oceanicaulis sp.]
MSVLTLSRRACAAAVLAAAVSLGGCISLLPETQPRTLYRLDPADLTAGGEPRRSAIPISLERVDAPRALSNDKIALERGGAIAYMAGAGWAAPAPALFQGVLEDAFHAVAPHLSPVRPEDGVGARYRLDAELRRFEAVYDQGDGAAPLVRVTVRARLIDRAERELAGRRVFTREVRASAHRQGSIVDAFSHASREAARDLARWAGEEICAIEPEASVCN